VKECATPRYTTLFTPPHFDVSPVSSLWGPDRRRGKNEGDEKRELIFKEDGQEYAQVLRMLGNGRLEAACIDGVKRLCHIRGKMRKKVWVSTGDVILLGLRDYQDEKADVILKYAPDEARSLKAYGELPDNFKIDLGVEDDGAEEEEDYVDFDDTDRPDLDLDLADI
jgi:translation initiation factor 1A